MDYNVLIEKAIEASKQAYAPYSNFQVGACILTDNGNTYTGCNMENASFGLTICAERNAIANAIANGERKIKAVGIYSPKMENCYPCGACRQVISEFSGENNVDIILKSGDELNVFTIKELLPGEFKL